MQHFLKNAIKTKLYSTFDTYPYVRLFIDWIILIKVKHLGGSVHRSGVFGKLQHATNYRLEYVWYICGN